MAKYRDVRGVGRSQLIPRKQGEAPAVRHERRLKANLSMKATLAAWCCERGISLNTTNGGHHWQFRGKQGGLVAFQRQAGAQQPFR